MRTNPTAARNKTAARRSASIRSILSLAGGMAAVPLVDSAAEATIIVTSTQGGRVGSGGFSSLTLDLPGTAQMVMQQKTGDSSGTVKATITNGLIGRQANNRSQVQRPGSNVAFRTNANVAVTWNANGANRTGASTSANIIRATNNTFLGPGAFSNKFLLFTFTNSLAANQTNYGWVEMTNGNFQNNALNNYVTFGRWAYQNDGSVIGAGQTVAVPEPTTAAMAMAGALVAGAAGLRRYRKQQAAAKAAAAA